MGLTRDAFFFDALADHAQKSVVASRLLVEMLDRLDDAPAIAKKIKELEHEGDKITHGCLAALHQTWITPLDREEIHAILGELGLCEIALGEPGTRRSTEFTLVDFTGAT